MIKLFFRILCLLLIVGNVQAQTNLSAQKNNNSILTEQNAKELTKLKQENKPCPVRLRLDGNYGCLSDYKFSNFESFKSGRKVVDIAISVQAWTIAGSKEDACEAIYIQSRQVNLINPSEVNAAKNSCERSGCKCEIFLDNGAIVNTALFEKYARTSVEANPTLPNALPPLVQQVREQVNLVEQARHIEQQRLVADAQQKEQDRILAEKIAKEQQIAADARDKEQQRLAQEAQQQEQLRIAQVARQKELEKILVEQKVKEQERLADAARSKEQQRLAQEASELSRLRAEAEEAKRIQAQLEEQLRLAKLQNQVSPPSAMTTMANRKALVIGNDSYKSVTKLLNAREDAKSIASNLTAVGYKVTLHLDLNEKEMKAALRTFSSQVQGGDEVMFFFAGHGVQLGATNYLLPTDIGGESEAQVKDEAIQLQRILDDMTEKKAKFTLAMIDACRDNPFKSMGRNIGGRGLAPTTAATGQMVVFSAGSGQQALDRLGSTDKNKNGVFTRTFLKEMQKSGVSIDRIVKNVRNEVAELAKTIGHEQVPAIYDQVLGDFYFKK